MYLRPQYQTIDQLHINYSKRSVLYKIIQQFSSRNTPNRNVDTCYQKTHVRVFIAALFVKSPKLETTEMIINIELWYLYTTDYPTVNEQCSHVSYCLNEF